MLAQDMSLYVPPDRPWDLKLRSRQSFRESLERVMRLWRIHADARGDDVDQIDLSYVIRRLLESGVDAAWEQYGGSAPKTEEQWSVVEAAVRKHVKRR